MIFSGDVTFDYYDKNINERLTDEQIQISYDKYYLSNKIFLHINLVQLEEKVTSGENYLVKIDPTVQSKTKNIILFNRFFKN